jgi:hypothetical protein
VKPLQQILHAHWIGDSPYCTRDEDPYRCCTSETTYSLHPIWGWRVASRHGASTYPQVLPQELYERLQRQWYLSPARHVALEVGDIDEALAFYGRLFEFELRGRSKTSAQQRRT